MARFGRSAVALVLVVIVAAGGSAYMFRRSRDIPGLRAAAEQARLLGSKEDEGQKSWAWPDTFAEAHPEARRAIFGACFEEGGHRQQVMGRDGKLRPKSCLLDAAEWIDYQAQLYDDRRLSAWGLALAALLAAAVAVFVERRRRSVAEATGAE